MYYRNLAGMTQFMWIPIVHIIIKEALKGMEKEKDF